MLECIRLHLITRPLQLIFIFYWLKLNDNVSKISSNFFDDKYLNEF